MLGRWHSGHRIPRSTRHRGTPPRRRPRSSPMSPPSTAGRTAPGRDSRARHRPGLPQLRQAWPAGPIAVQAATSCTTSAGTPAASALCPYAPHPHVERRYLLVPGLRSSRIHILDTKPDPRQPRDRQDDRAGGDRAARPATAARTPSTAAPTGIYVSALGAPTGDGPGRHLPARPRDLRRPRAAGRSTAARSTWPTTSGGTSATTRMITSEWGTPEHGRGRARRRELLLGGKYGHQLHVWDLRERRHLQALDLGDRAADGAGAAAGARPDQGLRLRRRRHQPRGPLRLDLALVPRRTARWAVEKVIDDPGRAGRRRPAAAAAQAVRRGAAAGHRHQPVARRPVPVRLLLGHRRVPAVRRLRPVQPEARPARCARRHRRAARRTPQPDRPLNGGPQMVEVSRDGRRVYVTNSLYGAVGRRSSTRTASTAGWSSSTPTRTAGEVDPNVLRQATTSGAMRPHQVRLEGGDASSDSYCYPELTDVGSAGRCWPRWRSAPFTGSTRPWAGCSRSRSVCRSAAAAAVLASLPADRARPRAVGGAGGRWSCAASGRWSPRDRAARGRRRRC